MARIALLTGGSTPERDVALAGASQVAPALRSLDHDGVVVDTVGGPLDAAGEAELLRPAVDREPPSPAALAELARRENLPTLVAGGALAGFDLVFLVLHGGAVEGGLLQALLELAGLRFTGSGALGSGMAMDATRRKVVMFGGMDSSFAVLAAPRGISGAGARGAASFTAAGLLAAPGRPRSAARPPASPRPA